jgi:hypothetical protein
MTVVKSVGVISVAKMLGCLYALIGILIGAIFSLVALAAPAARGPAGAPGFPNLLFGVGAIIAIPIFYGVLGFIGGLISGGLYNLLAGMIGGIELELSRDPRSYYED